LAEQRQGTARERQAEIAHRDLVLDGEINQGRLAREELAKLSEEIQASLAEEAETARQSAGILAAGEASYNEKSGLLSSVQNVATEVQNALWKNTQDRTKLNNDLVAQRSLESRLGSQMAVNAKDLAKAEERLAQLRIDLAAAEADGVGLFQRLGSGGVRRQHGPVGCGGAGSWIDRSPNRPWHAPKKSFSEPRPNWTPRKSGSPRMSMPGGPKRCWPLALPGLHGPVGRLISVSTCR
jgi:hypothetical protein